MYKNLSILLILFTTSILAQDYTKQWNEYYSYLQISGIATNQNNLLASTDNSLFEHQTNNQENTKTSTLNGMSGEKISYFLHSESSNISIVGYENGLLEIINENKETTTIVDIINKTNIPENKKRINHINEYNGKIYLACDYGISVFNLDQLEFGDTYYMGIGGAQIQINQTTILGDYIYAATTTEGIKKALHEDSNIIDFSLWESIPSGLGSFWKTVVNFNDTLYGINNNNHIYSYDGTTFTNLFDFNSQIITDHRIHENNMLITAKDNVYRYDYPFTNITTINHDPTYNSKFKVATILNNEIFIGTENDGILHFDTGGVFIKNIKPRGPFDNNIFSVTANNNEVWSVYGDHTTYYNPYPLKEKGYSHLKNDNWTNTPYTDILGSRNLIAVTLNPFNIDQVFISSFFSGILEINNDIPTTLWNTTNSPLETVGLYLPTPNPNYLDLRVGESIFDEDGKLWFTQSRVDNGISSYDPENNTWQSISFSNILPNPLNDENGFTSIDIDQNNTKWIGSTANGIIGISKQGDIKKISTQNGLPKQFVTSVSIDKDDHLWIGTIQGLAVLYNTANYFTNPNPIAEPIIILDDGIAKELLFGQPINDIVTDGRNNKWIATDDTGVFYLSSDGQQTIYHFTKANSPLPSNSIKDLDIDGETGEVFFVTTKGMVSFNSNITSGNENLENVYAFPNPVKPEQVNQNPDLKVTIAGLKKDDKSNVKITDISGNLVFETTTKGDGTVQWDMTAFGKYKVASGVYIIMVTTEDGSETTTEKVMIIR